VRLPKSPAPILHGRYLAAGRARRRGGRARE